eukprot:gene3029-1302_t
MRLPLYFMSCLLVTMCMKMNLTSGEDIISTHTGKIGPGNYTYFVLHEKGTITLILESLVGDADIYVSKDVERPSYLEYDLQSTTCGLDIVTVPKLYKRPVYIAVFGHVYAGITKYKLSAIMNFEGSYESSHVEASETDFTSTFNDDDDEETQSFKSVLWTVLVGILKIILEIIF